MQLQFTAEELNFLANILLNEGDPAGLLDRVLARDLRFDIDELERLRELLMSCKRKTAEQELHKNNIQTRKLLPLHLAQLDSMIEKVSEACAML